MVKKYIVDSKILEDVDFPIEVDLQDSGFDQGGIYYKAYIYNADLLVTKKAAIYPNVFLGYGDEEQFTQAAEKYYQLGVNNNLQFPESDLNIIGNLGLACNSKAMMLLYMKYQTISKHDLHDISLIINCGKLKLVSTLIEQHAQRTGELFHLELGDSDNHIDLAEQYRRMHKKCAYFYASDFAYVLFLLKAIYYGEITEREFIRRINLVEFEVFGKPESKRRFKVANYNTLSNFLKYIRRNLEHKFQDNSPIKLLCRCVTKGDDPEQLKKLGMPRYEISSIYYYYFNLEEILHLAKEIEKRKKAISIRNNFYITVITVHPSGCFGDVSLAAKIIAELHKLGGNVVTNWIVETTQEHIVRKFNLPGINLICIDSFAAPPASAITSLARADKVISVPTSHHLMLHVRNIFERVLPLVCVSEYNVSYDGVEHHLGMTTNRGSKELGIFLSEPPIFSFLDFSDINHRVRREIEKVYTPMFKDDIRKNKLFFSYTAFSDFQEKELEAEPCIHFLRVAMHINTEDDIVVIGKWGWLTTEVFDDLFFDLKKQEKNFSIQYFGSFDIMSHKSGHTGRTITLIDPFPLTPQNMKLLLYYSNPFCLVTGDQTLGEAISYGKIPAYQCLPWKAKYIGAILKLLNSRHLTKLSTAYKYGYELIDEARPDLKHTEKMLSSFILSNAETLLAEARIFFNHVDRDNNAAKKFANAVVPEISQIEPMLTASHRIRESVAPLKRKIDDKDSSSRKRKHTMT